MAAKANRAPFAARDFRSRHTTIQTTQDPSSTLDLGHNHLTGLKWTDFRLTTLVAEYAIPPLHDLQSGN